MLDKQAPLTLHIEGGEVKADISKFSEEFYDAGDYSNA
jgi:hypothetical protein